MLTTLTITSWPDRLLPRQVSSATISRTGCLFTNLVDHDEVSGGAPVGSDGRNTGFGRQWHGDRSLPGLCGPGRPT